MKVNKKQIITLFVTVLLIVVLMGFKHQRDLLTPSGDMDLHAVSLYAFEIDDWMFADQCYLEDMVKMKPWMKQEMGVFYMLVRIVQFKYQLIIATFLIGLALFMIVRDRQKL